MTDSENKWLHDIRVAQVVAAWQRENGERMRKWRENEKMKRK